MSLSSSGLIANKRPPGLSRPLLWGALCLLVVLLLGTLVFLTHAYEENRVQSLLEESATTMAAEIRSGLLRNAGDVQLMAYTGGGIAWHERATDFLTRHREVVAVEWRSPELQVDIGLVSPYLPVLFSQLQRTQALPDIQQACANGLRYGGIAYAPSYFWTMGQGMGLELMEACLPVTRGGQHLGFLVVTYSLKGILAELLNNEMRRNRNVALTEADGTRLGVLGSVRGKRGVFSTTQLLNLPGAAYLLRVERPREAQDWLPNVLNLMVAVLALSLLSVLGLLVQDVRKRQKAESDLAQALAFRKAIENSLVTGLLARDMQGRISYVNPAFADIVGCSTQTLVGSETPAPYWPPERFDEFRHRQSVRTEGAALPREGFETELMRADGTRVPVRIIEAPLIDAQGQQTGWMSTVLDLSEQRRIDELTRTSQERLQATARLAMIGEMASLISHELNQPLAAIASYANGILNLLSDPQGGVLSDIEHATQRVAEQADRAGRVIRSVADLVRRREHAREPIAVTLLFERIAPLLQLQANKAGIDLRWDVVPDCPPVRCDRVMIEQVLLNLARNGIQAMPRGEPALTHRPRVLRLQAYPLASSNESSLDRVEFCVTDHGLGMAEDVRERLFTPFFTTKAEGMGLGLSLCRTVVEQHGGMLQFESTPGQGTVFRFTLPVAG